MGRRMEMAGRDQGFDGRASRLSAIIPGDLPLACLADAIFTIRIFDGDWNWASAEVRVSFPHLMTEAPAFVRVDPMDWNQ